MQTRRFTFEHLIFSLIWIVALGIRLLNLGEAPLSDFEADWAIQSFQATQEESPDFGPNPGYIFSTEFLFFLLGSGNALARFWPALVGSLLVLVPFGLRRLLGREAAILLALGLAFDPGLTALSRLAGGPMMALGFGALALVCAYNRRWIGFGILAGLALISGPWVLTGLIGLAIAWIVGRSIGASPGADSLEDAEPLESPARTPQDSPRLGLIVGSAVAVLVGTLFLRHPSGLGAWAEEISAYLQGWQTPSGIPALRLPLALLFYQPLAVLFGLMAALRGWVRADSTARWLSIWAFAAVLLPIFYPGRQVFDVAGALLPLWALAALELSRYLNPRLPRVAAVQGGVVFILLVLFWLVSQNLIIGVNAWLVMVIVPILIGLTTILVGTGWSWETGQTGLVWGVSAALCVLILAANFGASQVRPNSAKELWAPPPAPVQLDLLVDTLKDLAILQNGRDDQLEIVSLVESPSLRWALRGFEGVQFAASLGRDLFPDAILAFESDQSYPQLASYRGQDFLLLENPGWEGAIPYPWFQWLTARQATVWPEWVVLWARSDLFPDDEPLEPVIDETFPEEGGGAN